MFRNVQKVKVIWSKVKGKFVLLLKNSLAYKSCSISWIDTQMNISVLDASSEAEGISIISCFHRSACPSVRWSLCKETFPLKPMHC